MGSSNLLFGALVITLLGVCGLLLILLRLSRRVSASEVVVTPDKNEVVATILRVLSTEKLDRHELKIDLLLDVKPPDAASYQLETAWVIRVGRIVQMQLGQTFPVKVEDGAVRPIMAWAKTWREGYAPSPQD